MNKPKETKPATVPETAKQAGETQRKWSWVEPEVWTERMLAALEQGVKGGKWFSLIDKVFSRENLLNGFYKVKRNKGSAGADNVSIDFFEKRLEENLTEIEEELKKNAYEPGAIRRRFIPKAGSKELRPLGIPSVKDRVVQSALRNVLEPIFEAEFAEQSYGFRPGRGCKDALRRVDQLLHQGYTMVVDIDIKSYFDTIPHDRLMVLIEEKISDRRILQLLGKFLNQKIFDGLKEWSPDQGSPQGAVISPLLSNIYLNPLDQLMRSKGFEMVRYADDQVILCRTPQEAKLAYETVKTWMENANLALHPEKTRIVDVTQKGGFEFLGYLFEQNRKSPRQKSLKKFKDSIRKKTGRSNGKSLREIIATLNPSIRGWFEYFKHSYRTALRSLDGWIRRRIRSILRSRMKIKGISKGMDHQRWPNSFFQENGLFSLETAHLKACQSR